MAEPLAALATELARRRQVSEWIAGAIRERAARACRGPRRSEQHREHERTWGRIYRDTRQGRGQAGFDWRRGDDLDEGSFRHGSVGDQVEPRAHASRVLSR